MYVGEFRSAVGKEKKEKKEGFSIDDRRDDGTKSASMSTLQ